MRLLTLGVMLVGVSLATPAQAADVHITIADGKVSVSATDATIGQILSEWARVGQTRIVNAERLPSAPMSLQLDNVSEAQALDTVLRSASGYLAAPRSVAIANASAYDRIFVLANSAGTPARPTTIASPPPAAFAPPVFQTPPPNDEPQGEPPDAPRQAVPRPGPPINAPRGAPLNQPPIQQQQPPVQSAPTQAVPMPTGAAQGPVGVSTPGMVVPAPTQPGQARPNNP